MSNHAEIMESRGHYYDFLARLFEKEMTGALLQQVSKLDYSVACGQEEMQSGYALLGQYFAGGVTAGMEDDLAADYAKTFLAAGEAKGNAAFPYESVYTSEERLLMQDAWTQVKGIYASHGLALKGDNVDLKEDHIAIELKYMAYLCRHGSVADQKTFLKDHLLNWCESFCQDIATYSGTDFYRGAAKVLLGYLKLEESALDELEIEEGVSYCASADQMDAILAKLSKKYKIYAPKKTNKKGRNGEEIVRYGEISSVKEIVYDRQSHFSAKEVYYPIVQTMIYFTEDTSTESKVKDDRGILIFAHPCDINAIRRLDNIFMKNGDNADVYYARLREKVKFVLLECAESYENCYCVSMGSNVADNYDLAVRMGEDGCKVQVKDAALAAYFTGMTVCEFAPAFVTENKRTATVPVINGKEEMKVASNLEFWKEYDEKCISCGGCNTVCPTCSCFDTVDVIYDETSRDGERRRVWSSCMLESFTQTAGGARARKTPGANMRFKALHKVYDYQKRFECGENMCVGCGRCVARCPKDIDFLDTINRFHDEMEKAKKEGKE